LLFPACSSEAVDASIGTPSQEEGSNPFLEDQSNRGKEDTAYINPDGIEVEVDLEGDTGAPGYQRRKSPAYISQFATTYLLRRGKFYLESLAEQATSASRAEWLVDGSWLTAEQANSVDPTKLKHWRVKGMNAVLLGDQSRDVSEGSVLKAKTPINPFSVMRDAGDKCADPDDHMTLSSSVYWYMWNPERENCSIPTQELTVTVSKLVPRNQNVYPEYDKLVADGKITSVILFGQIGDGAISDTDVGMRAFGKMARWLTSGGFAEVAPAPVGRRFTKRVGAVDFEVDLYSPHDFAGLGDSAHLSNFEKAIKEHEVVTYDGHSMLGASDFWARPDYPMFYQIFLYGGCLGYEYYVEPIVRKKNGWENLDLMSSVVEVSATANEFAGPVLAKIMWALEHNYDASWRDILTGVRQRVGNSSFGVSGVRDNCYSPSGSVCTGTADPNTSTTYENGGAQAIPDNDPTGLASVIEVPDVATAKSVKVLLDVSHTYVGDLRITLEHDGASAVLWDKTGGSQDDILQIFDLPQFAGKEAFGTWTLKLVDTNKRDTGTLNRWSVAVGR
jgi:hypothetical protein